MEVPDRNATHHDAEGYFAPKAAPAAQEKGVHELLREDRRQELGGDEVPREMDGTGVRPTTLHEVSADPRSPE